MSPQLQLSLFPTLVNEDKNVAQSLRKAGQESSEEAWRQSIPAQVFLNHYFAIDYHIRHSLEAYSLYNLPHFRDHHPTMTPEEVETTKKLLINCWSSEYALRSTGSLGDSQYLRHALHWTFPQAYYSILFGLRGFLMTHSVTGSNEELIRREVSKLVVKGFYPQPIAFYAAGHYDDYVLYNLPFSVPTHKGLSLPNHEAEAQTQIGQFLKTTRTQKAKSVRRYVQSNPQLALRSKSGEILEKFNAEHWQQLTWRVGYTTFFDLLMRLKISANYREIERFTEADINFKLFHKTLLSIVSYINFIHESYIAKAMGLQVYQQWIQQLPPHLLFVQNRFEDQITDIFREANHGPSLQQAA